MSSGGLEVLVQLVIAASTTEPLPMFGSAATVALLVLASAFLGLTSVGRAVLNPSATKGSDTRSWGRRGPARLGSTVLMSTSTTWVKDGSGWPGSANMPCSRQ